MARVLKLFAVHDGQGSSKNGLLLTMVRKHQLAQLKLESLKNPNAAHNSVLVTGVQMHQVSVRSISICRQELTQFEDKQK